MTLFLLILSFMLFLIGAVNVVTARVNFIAAGLAAYVAAQLVGLLP